MVFRSDDRGGQLARLSGSTTSYSSIVDVPAAAA